MRRSDRAWRELEALRRPFLPEEQAEGVASAAAELRARVGKVEQQVLAQYTAMAAYATIGDQRVDAARAEARADLDRAHTQILSLLERLRREIDERFRVLGGGAPGGGTSGSERLASLEASVAALTEACAAAQRENAELRSKVAPLLERHARDGGWLGGDIDSSTLSMH